MTPAPRRTMRFTDFDVDPVTLARRILGQQLVRVVDGQRRAGVIVEVEAYLGADDKAAHTHDGRRTERNASMYLPGGHAYVYFTYGMHYCMNLVCGAEDEGVAVLVRALAPAEGIESMFRHRPRAAREADLCSGPAKLTQALSIDREFDGYDLTTGPDLFVERLRSRALPKRLIAVGPRIGIDYAEEWTRRPLRFYIKGSPFVSRR